LKPGATDILLLTELMKSRKVISSPRMGGGREGGRDGMGGGWEGGRERRLGGGPEFMDD